MDASAPLYIDVDVEEGSNCWPLQRIFQALGDPREVSRIVAPDPRGDDVLCQVTGWSSSGPCQGYAVLVADSGEGAVTLIYGGDQGVRFKPIDNHDFWDLDNPDQWGEPCLLLDPDVHTG